MLTYFLVFYIMMMITFSANEYRRPIWTLATFSTWKQMKSCKWLFRKKNTLVKNYLFTKVFTSMHKFLQIFSLSRKFCLQKIKSSVTYSVLPTLTSSWKLFRVKYTNYLPRLGRYDKRFHCQNVKFSQNQIFNSWQHWSHQCTKVFKK